MNFSQLTSTAESVSEGRDPTGSGTLQSMHGSSQKTHHNPEQLWPIKQKKWISKTWGRELRSRFSAAWIMSNR